MFAAYPDDDDDYPRIDFVFDGDTQLGPERKKVRRGLAELRTFTDRVLQGGDPEAFCKKVGQLYASINQAINLCDRQAKRFPAREGFFYANIEAYNEMLDALEAMDAALENADATALNFALKDFENGVDQIDELVAEEKANN